MNEEKKTGDTTIKDVDVAARHLFKKAADHDFMTRGELFNKLVFGFMKEKYPEAHIKLMLKHADIPYNSSDFE